MHGNTMVKVLGITIRKEALTHVEHAMLRYNGIIDIDAAVAFVTDGVRPGTIGAMCKTYINSMSNDAYRRFASEVLRRVKAQRRLSS